MTKNLFMAALAFLAAGCATSRTDNELARLESALNEPHSQAGLNIASADLTAYWEERLHQVEAEIFHRLDERGQEHFIAERQAWEAYRVATARFAGDAYRDGSIEPLVFNLRFRQVTEERVDFLSDYRTDRWPASTVTRKKDRKSNR